MLGARKAIEKCWVRTPSYTIDVIISVKGDGITGVGALSAGVIAGKQKAVVGRSTNLTIKFPNTYHSTSTHSKYRIPPRLYLGRCRRFNTSSCTRCLGKSFLYDMNGYLTHPATVAFAPLHQTDRVSLAHCSPNAMRQACLNVLETCRGRVKKCR